VILSDQPDFKRRTLHIPEEIHFIVEDKEIMELQ
jgi:hypothetical protein